MYEGTNQERQYQNIRLGLIIKVNTDIAAQDEIAGKISYGTLDIEWIEDTLTISSRVPIMYPLAGDGWGIYGCPEVGDLAICSFKASGVPIVLGYIKKSAINQLGQVSESEVVLNEFGEQQPRSEFGFVPLRPLIPGEIFIRSKELSEMYLDRNGSFRLIARQKRSDLTSKTMTSRVFEMILGNSYGEDLKTALLDKFGKIYNLYLKHAKGGSLGFNERGDLTIDVKGVDENDGASIDLTVQKEISLVCGKSSINVTKEGLISLKNSSGQEITLDEAGSKVTIKDQSGNSIVMNGSSINIGSSATSFAVVGNLLITILNSMINILKIHTHTSAAPGSPTTPSVELISGLAPVTASQILSSKTKLE